MTTVISHALFYVTPSHRAYTIPIINVVLMAFINVYMIFGEMSKDAPICDILPSPPGAQGTGAPNFPSNRISFTVILNSVLLAVTLKYPFGLDTH